MKLKLQIYETEYRKVYFETQESKRTQPLGLFCLWQCLDVTGGRQAGCLVIRGGGGLAGERGYL